MVNLSRLEQPESGDIDKVGNAIERESRRLVNLAGFGALENGATFALSLLDLTYDGCKIETPIALLPGLSLRVSVERLGVIYAKVRWSSNGRAGLRFQSSGTFENSQKPRAHTRQAVTATAQLRRSGPNPYKVVVNDLTSKGCKIEFVERPRIGETVWAKFEGLEALESKVRWVDGAWSGLEFSRPLYPSVFDLLLIRLGVSLP